MRIGARAIRPLSGGMLSADSLRMLEDGSAASPAALAHLLGREPEPFIDSLSGVPAALLRTEAIWGWTEPLLRASLAAVWLITAWVSLFVYPVPGSLHMLARVGLHGILATFA